MEDGSPNDGPFCLAFYWFRVRFTVRVGFRLRVGFRVRVSERDLWLPTGGKRKPVLGRFKTPKIKEGRLKTVLRHL